jgi:UDPglucose 6-dehydrogenase
MIRRNVADGRLRFTSDAREAALHGKVQFIAVGTPPDEDGSADLQHVLAAARNIGRHMDGYRVVVDKSTVPVGTAGPRARGDRRELARAASRSTVPDGLQPRVPQEGAAVDDFCAPDRIVIGADSDARDRGDARALRAVRAQPRPLLVMDIRSAELTKYAANAMLATRISFMNELAHLAETSAPTSTRFASGIGSRRRIGYPSSTPAAATAARAFRRTCRRSSERRRERTPLGSSQPSRRPTRARSRSRTQDHARFGDRCAGRRFALWGLAFKPNTDDMREAPSRVLIDELLEPRRVDRRLGPRPDGSRARLYADRPGLRVSPPARSTPATAPMRS